MKRRCWITVLLIGLLTSMIVIAQDVPDLSQGIQVLSLLADPYGANTYLIKDQFERLGWTVTFAAIGESVSPCSNLCSAFLPDIRIEDIPSIAAYDVVVVMPTPGTFYQKPDPVGDLRANECAVSLIADAYHQGLRLYTGCSGILVFGDAGVLEGASVISHRNMLRYCPDFGAVCTSGSHRVRPMIDNQLVTATNQRVWPIEIAAALARSLDLLVPITPSINSIVARDLALEETSLDIPYSTISGRTAGTPLADIGRDVCVVSDGRVLVGMTYSPQDREDVLVIKYSEAGEIVWARAIGGPGRDFAEGVCASDDGGVYIAGYTTSAGQGVEDALLIRMDASGEVVWKTTAGGADYDAAFDVCLAADGAPVLCGLTNSSGKGLSDIYTVKADAQTGTILWETTTGGPLIERGHSIVCLADGSFLIGGGTNSRGAGNLDMHLVHLGAEGEQLWIKTVGDSVYDIANAAIPLADNGFLLVGHGDHEFSEIMALTVRRMDCERNTLWMTQLGVNKEHDYGFDGVELEDGRLVIVGVTAEPVPGENDIWILVMDGSGNLLEDFTVGGPEPEWPRGICLSPDGTLIIAGQTGSYGAGSYDAMMLEVKLP
ncbi:hypothetical protein KKG90_10095 [Candidatus Bipolaricaulota bacterium]|nr:hypothetical protein [Candidatus Bipolaricaulota bacterium]